MAAALASWSPSRDSKLSGRGRFPPWVHRMRLELERRMRVCRPGLGAAGEFLQLVAGVALRDPTGHDGEGLGHLRHIDVAPAVDGDVVRRDEVAGRVAVLGRPAPLALALAVQV